MVQVAPQNAALAAWHSRAQVRAMARVRGNGVDVRALALVSTKPTQGVGKLPLIMSRVSMPTVEGK